MSQLRSAFVCSLQLAFALVCAPFVLMAQAPSGNVVISANTTWPAANYNVTSLTVQGGAVLTIGGGSTVTVTGATVVTGTSGIVLQGANTTAKVGGAWVGVGVTVTSGSVQVDAGSSINADSQGYVNNAGPGYSGGSGGSYGGLGGYGNPAPVYGSASAPVDLGSGGSDYQYGGSYGGGAVRLIVSGTLTNNGVISANGEIVEPARGGAGSGGSVYVTTAGLAGSGIFTANGGSNTTPTLSGAPAGGGGRVAVYYAGPTTFTGFARSTAAGGAYTGTANGYAGSDGTAVFFDTAGTNSKLNLYHAFTIPATTTATYSAISVQNGGVLTVGGGSVLTVTGAVTLSGNSTMVLQSINNTAKVSNAWAGVGVTLQAASVQVDAGSSINADAQGYVNNAGPGYSGGSGGSYGGLGGYGTPAPIYGSSSAPVDLGSGGSDYQYGGSYGGGAIRLIVSGTLTNNGVISANGEIVEPARGGAGSGGSVYVTTAGLAGSGTFAANGGSNRTPTLSGAPAGGGGRVAVYYAGPTTFTGFAGSTASGGVYTGTASGYAGTNGTAVFVDTSVPNGNLSSYQGGFQVPANTTAQYNSVTIANGAAVTIGSGSTISVSNGLSVGTGGTLTVGGGSTLTVGGAMAVTGNSAVVLQSINNTVQVNGAWIGSGVTLKAGSVQVDAGSSINADAQGYVNNAGPGYAGGNGGSYGGLGGYFNTAAIYGSASAPVDLGSGGSDYQYGGSYGGGAVRLIVTGTLTNNGVISANGEKVEPSRGGAGSGGSVYVTTAGLAGSGTFNADGGSNTTPTLSGAPAGGGGRVAVYYAGPATFTGFNSSSANGGLYTGTATGYAGANGTAAFFDTSVPNNNVSIYPGQGYQIPPSSIVQYNSLSIGKGATVVVGGAAQVLVAQAMRVTGTVTAQSINTTATIGGKWLGRGVLIGAGSLQVDATGSVNADGQGYTNNLGPAAGSYITGGSYGGAGGGQDPSTVYGSKTAPVDLGSGGGSGQNTGGGTGGGAIELLIAGTLTNNGVISANGPSINNSGYGGGGAGGSVIVEANTLTGSGTYAAIGGSNITPTGVAGDGGGGGRLSIKYVSNSGVSQNALSAAGGTGAVAGTAGTINFVQGAGLEFLQPVNSAIHGLAKLAYFSDTGVTVTASAAGPQTLVIPTTGPGYSTAIFDTTVVPDGKYELRLTATDSNNTLKATKNVVVNNSVKWFSGVLTANTHWTANNVYAIDGDLIIPAGITLLVDPGTVVKALPTYQILVQAGGTLTAPGGSAATPVIFTTFDDFTAGGNTAFNQGVSVPQPGEWNGVQVQGGTFNADINTTVRYAQLRASAVLSGSTVLQSGEAYEVSGTLTVPAGVTLTLQPGSIIKFDAGAGLTVNPGGKLIANGTLAQPIYLTSINDNSIGANLTGNTTAPAPGDWNSIFINGGIGSFNFVHMLYGGGPIPTPSQIGMLQSSGAATITISNSTFANSFYIGIQTGLFGGGDTYTITNSTFYGNQDRTINAYNGTTLHVVNSTFDGNFAGIINHGGAIIDVENTVVTGSTSTAYGGIYGATTLLNNDVFTTAAGVFNYGGGLDPTGTNGNISANPVYMNGPQHDYRPTYGSPLIDAANGTVANYPMSDSFNDPRFNAPLVTAKKGTADAGGKFPDIGAFEFVQMAPSDLDLTVSNVVGPTSALVGSTAQVTWTVTNIGVGTVYGPWHDAVYLVHDPSANSTEIFAGQFLEGQNVILGPGATYSGTATVTVPGTVVGEHSWEVKTNVRGEVFEGANTANNKGLSLNPVLVDVPALTVGTGPLNGMIGGTDQSAYYKITPGATQTTRIQLALPLGGGSVQLFVGGGYVPSPQHYDYQQVEFNSTTASLVIPSGSAQTFYVTVYGQSITGGAPAAFTLQASVVQFSLTNVSPASVTTQGPGTITFTGGGFTSGTTFQLTGGGNTYNSTSVFLTDADHAEVTFAANLIPAGTYTAQATNGSTVTLANAIGVVAASPSTVQTGLLNANVQVTLETPKVFRKGFPSTVTLNYKNIGGSDIPAPLIYLYGENANLSPVLPRCDGCDPNFPLKASNTFNSGLVLGINKQGPAGILPSGASGSIEFTATPSTANTVYLGALADAIDPIATQLRVSFCQSNAPRSGAAPLEQALTGPFDGSTCVLFPQQTGAYASAVDFCASLLPPGLSAAAASRSCMLLLNNSGYSYTPQVILQVQGPPSLDQSFAGAHLPLSGFTSLLAADATALSASGIYESDLQKVLSFELQKDGLAQLSVRYHQGAFGYGASHTFDINAQASAQGVTLYYPNGSARLFTIPSPTQPGVFLGTVGDYATASSAADGSSSVTENDGTVLRFIPSSTAGTLLLDSVVQPGGYKVQLAYTGNLVTSATDSLNNKLTLQYDANNHITQSTDPAGRITTFTYTKNNFLTSIVNSAGTTSITWNTGGPSGVGYLSDSCITTYCEPAIGITSIAFPDGTHTFYTYDAAGRLTSRSRDGNTGSVTYTYNNDGTTSVTDANGKTSVSAVNASGVLTAITDAIGNTQHLRLDPENKLIGLLGALGDSSSVSFDGAGHASNVMLPTGISANFNYASSGLLSSLTDPLGSTFGFTFDPNAYLTATADPAGRKVTYTYDAQGNPLTRTNRRGQTTTYTYAPDGQLASIILASGAQTTFTYGTHSNLQSAITSAGTTQYTYDAADRLTAVSNPDGTSLTYAYNAGGQLTSLRDSTGFTTNYAYDAAGHLLKLTDGSGNNVVSYTYDPAGRLVGKALGNGASTSIAYNADGDKTSIIHYSPTHAVLGEYDYTYDANNQPISEKTPSGTLSFGYDLDGQLTSAGTPAGAIQYSYDDSGNRTSVTSSGRTVNYIPNNLDQYTSVNGVPYLYDADGDLLFDGTYTYTYNELGQMLSAVKASDTWAYTYGALGARTSSTHNGTTTRYLVDPTGYGNVVATFSGSGTLLSHFVYGKDLTSAVSASGVASYYHFDGTGNTTQMTGPSGAVVNSYVYLPFGERTTLAANVSNPFTFGANSGVVDEGSGLYLMRNRTYNPILGRFQQQDPTGLGSDLNLYRYVLNSPVQYVDPTGNDLISATTDSTPVHIFNAVAPSAQTVVSSLKATPLRTGFNNTTSALGAGSTSISLGANLARGDGLGVIHDLGLLTAAGIDYAANRLPPTPLGYVLRFVAHNASAIDEISMNFFGDFFDSYYQPPSPFAQPPRPCGGCLTHAPPGRPIPVGGSLDPNGKLTSGFGDQGFVPVGAPIVYTIYFENQSTATLPAQKVTVTDALPANLDWSTVQLNQVNFNNVTLNIPDGTQTYKTQANVSSDTNPVSVAASLNPVTGVITWTMQSVDPVTLGAPANPLAGFLPPNTAGNNGDGSVVFSVQPKAALSNAASIVNQGSIIFDVNTPIVTNTVTNTIDSSIVTSAISALPATTAGPSIPVTWTGSDASGSGIASYNIYVSFDSDPYTLWLSGTTLTTANYTVALAGHTYTFISLAVNNVGIAQTVPAAPQTTTVVLQTPTVTVTPASAGIQTNQPLSVVVTVASTPTPTGTVTLSSGTYTSAAATLASGSVTIIIPAGALAAGSDTLTASYAPDNAASNLFNPATGAAAVTVGTVVNNVQVTVGTSPAGQAFAVDGASYTSTQILTWVAGSTHTLSTTSPQTAAGTQRTFTAWSDAGAISHTVTAPAAAATYTASFSTAFLLTTAANPVAGGVVAPASGTYYPAGTVVNLVATPAAGYNFASWTGSVASTTSAATTVTLTAPQTVTANFTAITLQTPAVTVTPASANILANQSLSVVVSVGATSTPTGSVVLSSGSYTSATVALVSGSVTIVIPAGALATASDTLTATYTPDAASTKLFNTATGAAAVTVGPVVSNVQVTVGTSPAGQSFAVDGTNYSSAQTLTWTVGSTHTLATTSPQTAAGTQRTFTAWSDAGAISHSVTVPATATSYTASFSTAYLLTTAANPATGGSVIPVAGTYYPAGTVVNLVATPASGYTFGSWTGAVASSTSAATTITLSAPQTVTANFVPVVLPVISLSPAALNFTATAGSTSPAQTVQLTNTGNGVLNIAGLSITGTGAATFAQTNTCGSSLAAGATCTISVSFAPPSAATFTAALTISSNATGTAPTVSLSGTGTAVPTFTVAASPATQTVGRGSDATYLINVTPQGGAFPGTVAFTVAGLPTDATYTFAPPSVTPGSTVASSTLTVHVPGIVGSLHLPDRSTTTPVLAVLGCVLLATRRRRRWLSGMAMALALLCTMPVFTGCASRPSTSSTITITATGGATVQTTTVTLVVQ